MAGLLPIASPVKLSAIYHGHAARGAAFVDRDGWRMPARYTSVEEEVSMVRSAGGICDISPVGKLGVQGADVLARLSVALALPETLEVGWVERCSGPDAGGIVAVAGLAYDEAMAFTPTSQAADAATWLEERLEGCAHLVDVTSSWAGICVAGPLAYRVLSKIVELDLDPRVFADRACAQGKAAGVHAIALRADASGLLAYELFVTRDYGEYLWNALVHAGRREGVGPVGVEAMERIRAGA